MRRFPLTIPLGLALAACGGGDGEDGGSLAQIGVGDPAPAYAAATLSGDTVSLESLRGDVVLLNIWATWCIPCRREMPALERLHAERAGEGLRVVGVSIDGASADVGGFAQDLGVGFTILHDPQSRVTHAFRTIGVPESFLISREGVILKRWVGPFDPASPQNATLIEEALAS